MHCRLIDRKGQSHRNYHADMNAQQLFRSRVRKLTWGLFALWLLSTFGLSYCARDLKFEVAGWPFNFWMAAQGSVLVYITITVVYARWVNRWERERDQTEQASQA